MFWNLKSMYLFELTFLINVSAGSLFIQLKIVLMCHGDIMRHWDSLQQGQIIT